MSDSKPRLTALRPQATPIPPSLAAKMAAMATKNTTDPQKLPTPGRIAMQQGMARRPRPGFKLSDIDPTLVPDNTLPTGPMGAGLGAGRPLAHDQPRRPNPANAGTPFANFSKIVYVLSSTSLYICSH